MELGSALVGAIAIIICVLPFALMNRSKKQRRQSFLDAIHALANQNKCEIHKSDVFSYFAIGVDENKGVVFFYKKSSDKEITETVHLSDIRLCKIIKSNSSLNKNGQRVNIIEKQSLTLAFKEANKADISLEFFNSDDSVQLCGEIQACEKWMELINLHISSNN